MKNQWNGLIRNLRCISRWKRISQTISFQLNLVQSKFYYRVLSYTARLEKILHIFFYKSNHSLIISTKRLTTILRQYILTYVRELFYLFSCGYIDGNSTLVPRSSTKPSVCGFINGLWFAQYLLVSCQIIFIFHAEHGHITVVVCAEHLTYVMEEQNWAIFEFKMSVMGLSYISTAPRALLQCRRAGIKACPAPKHRRKLQSAIHNSLDVAYIERC